MGKRNVSSDVKKNYKAAAEFMHEVTKAYLCEAFMEWAGMDSIESTPTKITVPTLHASQEKKVQFMYETIGTFVDEYILPEFDVEKVWRLQQQQKSQERNHQAGKILLARFNLKGCRQELNKRTYKYSLLEVKIYLMANECFTLTL